MNGSRDLIREFSGTFFVFNTTHLTLKAEKLLNDEGVTNRLFPKPRNVASECGLILKVLDGDLEMAENLFREKGLPVRERLQIPAEKKR